MARIELSNQRLDALCAGIPELVTDRALAAHIGIDKGHLSRILNGDTPGPKFIANLLYAFGITSFGPFDILPEEEPAA